MTDEHKLVKQLYADATDTSYSQAVALSMMRVHLRLWLNAHRLEPIDPINVLKQQSAEGMPGPSVKIPMPKRDKEHDAH